MVRTWYRIPINIQSSDGRICCGALDARNAADEISICSIDNSVSLVGRIFDLSLTNNDLVSLWAEINDGESKNYLPIVARGLVKIAKPPRSAHLRRITRWPRTALNRNIGFHSERYRYSDRVRNASWSIRWRDPEKMGGQA